MNQATIQTNGTTLHYEDSQGSGDPVVLIHGWPLSGKSWAHQIQPLIDAGKRVIAYDRRGFGASEKPDGDYGYDTLTSDLHGLLEALDLTNVTLVGFSMGGGEVARYIKNHGEDRIKSIVFASAVPPYLYKSEDNPDGPLDDETASGFKESLESDGEAFYKEFVKGFYSADGDGNVLVSDEEVGAAIALCAQADKTAALKTMEAWATTDFRDDLKMISVPTLVLHGEADGTVPYEGSGKRTHEMVEGSELHVISGAPHGCNVSHADEFNEALVAFVSK